LPLRRRPKRCLGFMGFGGANRLGRDGLLLRDGYTIGAASSDFCARSR
jgi:hypothetical protein